MILRKRDSWVTERDTHMHIHITGRKALKSGSWEEEEM